MYIPIIKSRQGDIVALEQLSTNVFSQTKPLIQPTDVQEADCAKFIPRINQALAGKSATIYMDFSSFSDNYLENVQFILNNLSAEITFIPVINQNTSASLFQIIAPFITNVGCCLRIRTNTQDINLLNTINSVITRFGLNKKQVDLLIDCQYVYEKNIDDMTQHLNRTIPTINFSDYRSFGIASGSFLTNLGGILPDTVKEITRYEQVLYNNVVTSLKTKITYSDFGNQYPVSGGGDAEPFQNTPSCSIKYTGTDSYFIFRGRQPQNEARGTKQYFDKARLLVAHACYDGANFSWGDQQIQEKADSVREDKPGNSSNWVSITLNRHITKLHSIIN